MTSASLMHFRTVDFSTESGLEGFVAKAESLREQSSWEMLGVCPSRGHWGVERKERIQEGLKCSQGTGEQVKGKRDRRGNGNFRFVC